MYITRLLVKDYRNYTAQALSLGEGTTILCGANAQGKTNILEAIYLCSTGRSHRTPRDRELIQSERGHARIFAEVLRTDGTHTVEILLSREERKRIKVNGLPVQKVGEMLGHICTVMFSPEDLRVVKEGPAERRRFMDLEISQAKRSYFYALQRYAQALDQRNSLLKTLSRDSALEKTLSVWDAQLAEAAAPIVRERRRFCQNIAGIAAEIHSAISGGKELLETEYQTNTGDGTPEAIAQKLHQDAETDLRRGSTHCGPHRDDIVLRINGTDIRAYGSQGQQRTAALSLKLAEIELLKEDTGEYPVLLLDDVLSELDHERQQQLLERIRGIQTLVTCTGIDIALFPDARVLQVKEGTVTPEQS